MNKSTARPSKTEGPSNSVQLVIVIGFALSLSMGFLDMTRSILSRPSGFSSFPSVLAPLVATIGALFLIYVILYLILRLFAGSRLGHLLTFKPIPLAFSLALFLGTIFTLALPDNLLSLSLIYSFEFVVFLLISLLISIGVYFGTEAIAQRSSYRDTMVAFSLATPFVLGQTMVFMWLRGYRLDSFTPIQSFLLNIGYILAVLLTLALFYSKRQGDIIRILVIAFMAFVVLSPFGTLIISQVSKDHLSEFGNKDNKIKHVILVIVDTLRSDVLSCYNHQSVATPHIDQLAKDGILFTRAISTAPWTSPSVASIMTGFLPSVHMFGGVIATRGGPLSSKHRDDTQWNSKLSDNFSTLAEYMLDAGYFTAAIVSNPQLTPDTNIFQGFLEHNHPKVIGDSFGVKLLRRLFPLQFRTDKGVQGGDSTRDQTNLTIDWLESNYEKNFFLWIHYFDPHIPYAPPADFLPRREPPPGMGKSFGNFKRARGGYFSPLLTEREWIKDLYKSEVCYVDEGIGKILDTLKRLNLYDESLIVFTSDHGEEFWEHGGVEHGHSLYNEVLSVPLIIKLPLSISASKKQVSTVVSTRNIMPTILELCGIHYESNHLSIGSLSPLWGPNPNTFNGQPIISTGLVYYEDRESVIFDRLKYIRFLLTDREELYDLVRDPEEQISIVGLSRDKVQRARGILREHNEKSKLLRARYLITDDKKIKIDNDAMKTLRSLGYIQ